MPSGCCCATCSASWIATSSASSAGAMRCSRPERHCLGHAHGAAGEDEVLGPGETDERGEASRADGHAETGAGPGQLQVLATDPQVGTGHDLGARADAVADGDRDDRHRELVQPAVQAGERGHPRDAGVVIELLADVGTGAQRGHVGRRDDEHAQVGVGGELGEGGVQDGQRGGVEGVALGGPVQPEDRDGAAALDQDGLAHVLI